MAPGPEQTTSASTDASIGTHVAEYRIEALLGRGGMSAVYLAEDLRLRRRVALKVLAPELASDARFRERFLRESELAASIDHPNITPIYEAGEADGRLFIAMRYVEGTDLKALLRTHGALEPLRALAVASQIADALDAAHEHGLVHRDVKPSNVLVGPHGHSYLSDFGLTKRASDRVGPAGTGLVGSVDYVAPEQIRTEKVDGRTDVYSFGCLLFECLTGEVPFAHASEVAVVYAQLEEGPPRPSERVSGLPTALDTVLARAMAKLPDDRYATCRELVDAAADSLGLAVVPSKLAGRPRWGWLVIAAVTVVAAAIGGWLLTRTGGSVAPPGTDALVRIDPKTSTVVRTMRVGGDAAAVAVGDGAVWIANNGDDSVSRVDVATAHLRTIPVKGTPTDVAVRGNYVGVVNGPTNNSVVTIDATTARTSEPATFPGDANYAPLIAAGNGSFWLAEAEPQTLSSSDSGGPFFGLGETITIPSDQASLLTQYVSFDGLAVGEGSVWVAGDSYGRTVWRADPVSGKVTTIPLGFVPAGIAAGEGAVWVTSLLGDRVARIDPRSNRIVRQIKVGGGASAVAVGRGAVWVANSLDDTVSRIDARTSRVTTIAVGVTPADIAVGAGGVWVIGKPS
jgi:YVTN family beta-propeller protein